MSAEQPTLVVHFRRTDEADGNHSIGARVFAWSASAQQAPAKTPAAPPAKAPATSGPAQTPATAPGFTTQKEKLSYAIGMEMGKGVKAQGIDVDPAILLRGLKDAMSGGKSQMSEEEIKQVITGLQQELRQKQMQEQEAAAAENKAKGTRSWRRTPRKTESWRSPTDCNTKF